MFPSHVSLLFIDWRLFSCSHKLELNVAVVIANVRFLARPTDRGRFLSSSAAV